MTRPEVVMCEIIAYHNLPLATADSLSDGFKLVFPDSKIAADMKCGRQQATALVKTLGKAQQKSLSERMQTAAFLLSTDGSNNNRSKQFPIVIRSLDQNTGLVHSELLPLPICTGSATGENVCKILDGEINAHNLQWNNCLALECDNVPVMIRNKIGAIFYIRNKYDSVFLAGCYHFVQNAVQNGAKCLPDVAEILQDVYYYFQHKFSSVQDLFDIEQKRMLKHVSTRWLAKYWLLPGEIATKLGTFKKVLYSRI